MHPTDASRNPGIANLIGLFHHRWAVPVLAELDRTGGTRAVTLMRRLDVGRESLQRTLQALVERGLVRQNPGYGHPLQPEYLLTDRGALIARPAGRCSTACASSGSSRWA